ncbi:46 kDa FK506-binding nuclear protein [Schistocerca serialis cubense]|uniref:46 kDa FK506-binding nuclear protein n=1 Tax=Schistocerca serialis cubense TaxID=2023355 RepID=UPI00214E3B75|nr:46 kDa FK506-binding nuclear protein [Schistocerca serialis cubense]
MFWGLVLEPGKRYAQTVDKPFHISMASLDVMHSENDLVSVNVNFQNAEFILCNLQKNKVFQTPLDLNFMAGDKIAFYTSGKGRVHLTGYLIDDDDDMGIEAEDEESEEDETPQKNDVKATKQEKRKSVGHTPGKPALKKSKMESEDEDDGDDDDDSDLESLGDSDEEMEVESGEEDEDDDDDGEEEEDDSDEVEEETPQKQQLQGKNKEKQQSAQKQNKQVNTPNEMKKKKGKGPDAVTPNTPIVQANGTPETQSAKKNKKKGGETPGDKSGQTPKQAQTGSPAHTPQKKILEGGVAVEDSVIGSGQVAKPGRFVTVYYTGRLKQNNKKFDETVQGPGFKFRLGKGEVIKGWDIGVTGMKVGGKRKLIIPPHMAYGAKGSPPVIPPNSALVFEVELRNVN